MATNGRDPRETYEQHRQDIARILDWLDLELAEHQTKANADPANWNYVGDLAHVRQRLIETLAFISELTTESIENLLDESR